MKDGGESRSCSDSSPSPTPMYDRASARPSIPFVSMPTMLTHVAESRKGIFPNHIVNNERFSSDGRSERAWLSPAGFLP